MGVRIHPPASILKGLLMVRVCKISGQYYGATICKLDEDEIENIESLIYEGTPVIVGESLEDIADMLEIDVDDIL